MSRLKARAKQRLLQRNSLPRPDLRTPFHHSVRRQQKAKHLYKTGRRSWRAPGHKRTRYRKWASKYE